MLIVMQQNATAEQIARVSDAVRELGFQAHPMPGAQRTAICVTGNQALVPADTFAGLPGIKEIIRVSKPYKLVSREFKPEGTVLRFGDRSIGGDELTVVAGPCSVETADTTLRIAVQLREMGVEFLRAGAVKPRTSPTAFQGRGKEGVDILAKVKSEFGMFIVTELLEAEALPIVAEVADIIQIGARNMHNTPLLKRLGAVTQPILLKRGMAATLDEFLMAAEYIMSEGNYNVILCERGIRTISDHSRFTLDVAAISALRQISHLPVLADPSHAAGVSSMVAPLAHAAVAAGADGVMIEVHDDAKAAWCDGPQAMHPDELRSTLARLEQIRHAVAGPSPAPPVSAHH